MLFVLHFRRPGPKSGPGHASEARRGRSLAKGHEQIIPPSYTHPLRDPFSPWYRMAETATTAHNTLHYTKTIGSSATDTDAIYAFSTESCPG